MSSFSLLGHSFNSLVFFIRLNFAAVKAHAIAALLELEKKSKITRDDGFQGILNAIANDVRSKHRKRLQRQQEMESMKEALQQLAERKKYFQEQIDSYHSYVEAAMETMQHKKECVVKPRFRRNVNPTQEKALCDTIHQAIFPPQRLAENWAIT